MSNRLGQHYDRYNNTVRYVEFNNNQFDKNDLVKNFSNDKTQLSVTNEPNIDYSTRDEYIVISSVDRDRTNYPNPNHYTVTLPSELRNIKSIEIINGVIPDKNSVLQEPYLLLKIDELENTMISPNKPISDSFAILHLQAAFKSGYFLNVDKKTFEHVVLNYITPKAGLSKLTITITDSLGVPFDFGSDDGLTPDKSLQNMFVLKIVYLVKNRDSINQRNLY